MNKIRVIQHSKTVGYSGTDRVAQVLAKYLDRDKFDVYLLYREGDAANTRLRDMQKILGKDRLIPYQWKSGKCTRRAPYFPEEDNLAEVVKSIDPHIMHYHYSGYNEFPVFKSITPNARIISTNIFGHKEDIRQSDLVIYISNYNKQLALRKGGPDGPVLYNPIEQPPWELNESVRGGCREWLLEEFALPKDAIILTRLGRPDNFTDISLRAFKQLEEEFPNVYYLIFGPCNGWRDTIRNLRIRNARMSAPVIDDTRLWMIHIGTDIYAHARSDGDICPTSIQQMMMAGVPCISHISPIYNGQAEIIGDAGFIVGNSQEYFNILRKLVSDPVFRCMIGDNARDRASEMFDARKITKQLEEIYGTT